MRPATPRHPKHDSACPYCGEPFQAKKLLGMKMGDYACHRCKGNFSVVGKSYFIAGKSVAAWTGQPLEGGK